jgi:DNA ligase 1
MPRQIVPSGSRRYVGSPGPRREIDGITSSGHGRPGRQTRSCTAAAGEPAGKAAEEPAGKPAEEEVSTPERLAPAPDGPAGQQNGRMLLAEVVETSRSVAATRSRTRKIALLAELLSSAPSEELETAVAYLSGTLRQRRAGLGWRSLAQLPPPAPESTLRLAEVHEAFESISTVSGTGSRNRRTELVDGLFGRATDEEQRFLRLLVTGELRQGSLDALMLEAVAVAAEVSPSSVRRAAMLCGGTLPVAVAALTGGEEGLARFRLEVGRPVRPMLAQSASDVPEAFGKVRGAEAPTSGAGMLAVDCKIDGIRIQAHKDQGQVSLFTRSLEDITDRLPEVAEAVAALPAESLVLDGEAVALDGQGRPRPFQETGARTATSLDVAASRKTVPLTPYFFDLLQVDGEDLLDAPGSVRFDRLSQELPPALVIPRVLTDDPALAERYLAEVVAAGHEGVVVKDLEAPYEAGRRGGAWVKVKPRHTLDLVVLAVEWGSGRRQGWLSNIHLGARDPATGGFVMLGKTFKGMTDEMLRWQTERFLDLETHRDGHVVHLRPEQVVEIAFDGVQRSSRYAGGVALRFARVVRYRDDKSADEADPVELVRTLHTPLSAPGSR